MRELRQLFFTVVIASAKIKRMSKEETESREENESSDAASRSVSTSWALLLLLAWKLCEWKRDGASASFVCFLLSVIIQMTILNLLCTPKKVC